MVKKIAEDEDIPLHFLAKILQQLARKGILRSSKGPTGGFALQVGPEDVRLLDIVEVLDGLECYDQCAEGHAQCSEATTCAMHDSWMGLRSRIMEYLRRNTIADLSRALDRKKQSLNVTRRRPKTKRASVAAKHI